MQVPTHVEDIEAYEELIQLMNSPRQKRKSFIKDEVKIGRNDPCPCGSGKKYKKCCLIK